MQNFILEKIEKIAQYIISAKNCPWDITKKRKGQYL